MTPPNPTLEAEVVAMELPPLPDALCRDDTTHLTDYFTVEHMQSYARAAVVAALAQAAPQAAQQDEKQADVAMPEPVATIRHDGSGWDAVMTEHGYRLCGAGLLDGAALFAAQPAEGAEGSALVAPTDEQIVAALHACGIDTRPSKYGFDALQMDGTSVPNLRNVFVKLFAAEGATQAPQLVHQVSLDDQMATWMDVDEGEVTVWQRKKFTLRTLARIDGTTQGAQGDGS